MDDIITIIRSKINDPIKYRVVFDIDEVLCCTPINRIESTDKTTDKAVIKRMRQYPGAAVIEWKYDKELYVHFFYPGFDKLILSILSWDNWSVDFFSAGIKERNEEVIPKFLKQNFAKYTDNVGANYDAIVDSGRLRIFSAHHTVEGSKSCDYGEHTLPGYEVYGQRKKDLTIVSEDIANTILVDDDRSYVIASQYPFISTCYGASKDFSRRLHYEKIDLLDIKFNPLKSPEYIMGILLSCKEKLDSQVINSLRNALDLVLQHHGKTAVYGRDYSPWFLHPSYELEEHGRSKENSDFLNQMIRWIKKGEEYWSDKFITV